MTPVSPRSRNASQTAPQPVNTHAEYKLPANVVPCTLRFGCSGARTVNDRPS